MWVEERKHYFDAGGVKVHWGFKLLPNGFEAITLFGHVLDIRSKEDLRAFLTTAAGWFLVNHERIHIMQAESFKTKYLAFYAIYLWYWVIGLFKYGVRNNASYYNIPFEREAFANERNFTYNKTSWREYTN